MTDLGKIIEEIKIEFADVDEKKNAKIEVRQLCDARIIPYQFRQLMQNLISNAIKFADPSRPLHLIIESKLVNSSELQNDFLLQNHNYCHLTVTDNGIGFEHEFEEQIFEVFQRLHAQDEYPGTGIGLAIAKKIVENHNGTIKATSQLHKGTRFDIYLPQ